MNEQQTPRPGKRQVFAALGKAALYLGIFLSWQVLVTTVYSVLAAVRMLLPDPTGPLDIEGYFNAVMSKVMEISLISGVLTLVTVVLIIKLRHRSLRRELWLNPVPGRVLVWAAGLAFCLYWLVTLAMNLLPQSLLESYNDASAELEVAGVLPLIATALVAPVVEEVIFRGLVYTRLQTALPGWLAVLLSAAIFGLCHGNLVWFCYAFVLGFIFASVTRSARSILPNLLMHVVFNATNEVLAFFPDWEPGLWFFPVILVLATGGTVMCVIFLHRALRAVPVSLQMVEELPRQTVPDQLQAEAGPAEDWMPPAQAQWDPDSGPNHRFPPNRM